MLHSYRAPLLSTHGEGPGDGIDLLAARFLPSFCLVTTTTNKDMTSHT